MVSWILMLIMHLLFGVLFFAEKAVEKYYSLIYKILVFFLFFSIEYITLFSSINLEWGRLIIGTFLVLEYTVFSIYISIKSTFILKSIVKSSVLIFCMTFVWFFILSDKNVVSGDLRFPFIDILIQSGVYFAFHIPIIIVTRIISKKKSKKNTA